VHSEPCRPGRSLRKGLEGTTRMGVLPFSLDLVRHSVKPSPLSDSVTHAYCPLLPLFYLYLGPPVRGVCRVNFRPTLQALSRPPY
jgi:hypothetical protein